MSDLYISDDDNPQLPLIKYNKNINKPLVSYQNDKQNKISTPIIVHKKVNKRKKKLQNNSNNNRNNRWSVLCILCLTNISIWYCFDNITILHNEFYTIFNLNNVSYNLLYSISVFPSFILSIFTSYIISNFNVKYSLLISILLTLIGQIIFSISCSIYISYILTLCGRCLYGIGASFNSILSFIILYYYFNKNEFATSLSILFTSVRIGFVLNDLFTVYIYSIYSISYSIWFGALLIAISLIVTFYVIIKLNISTPNNNNNPTPISSPSSSHLYTFKIGFWLLLLIDTFGFAMYPTWNAIGTGLMQSKYDNITQEYADYYLLIIYIIPIIISPISGIILDKNESYFITLFIGGILCIIGHIMMMIQLSTSITYLNYIFNTPTVSLLFLSFGYTLFYSSLWPSIPYMINNNQYKLGTAYGIIYSLYCISYSISQLVCALFIKNNNNKNKYDYVCGYLITLSVIYSFIAAILWLWWKDDVFRYKHINNAINGNLSPSLSSLKTPFTIQEEEDDNIFDDDDDDDIDDDEGNSLYIAGSTSILSMGEIKSNVSTHSLWSNSSQNINDINQNNDSDQQQIIKINDTMLGYAGENEIIQINQNNNNDDDNSSTLSIITDND